jgi:hypothetical protein
MKPGAGPGMVVIPVILARQEAEVRGSKSQVSPRQKYKTLSEKIN